MKKSRKRGMKFIRSRWKERIGVWRKWEIRVYWEKEKKSGGENIIEITTDDVMFALSVKI